MTFKLKHERTSAERRKGERPRTMPRIAGMSINREEMHELAKRCRRTGQHEAVWNIPRSFRVGGLRFIVYFVLCWPKEQKVEVTEV